MPRRPKEPSRPAAMPVSTPQSHFVNVWLQNDGVLSLGERNNTLEQAKERTRDNAHRVAVMKITVEYVETIV